MPTFRSDDKLKALNPLRWLADQLMRWGLEVFCKRYYGTYTAHVVDNADPKGLGRIRFKCPAVGMTEDDDVPEEYWAWPCLPGVGVDPATGQMSGVWFPPDIGSTVWIQFEAGDPEQPLWIGGWVTQTKVMPELDHAAALRKGIRTRTGHLLRFSDDGEDLHVMLAKGDGVGGPSPSFLSMDKDGNVLIENDKGSYVSLSAKDDNIAVVLANDDGETEAMVTLGTDQVLLATASSGTVEIKGKDITLNGGTITMNCEKFLINSQATYLCKDAMEPAVLGNKQMLHQSLHIHTATAPGSPTTPPLPPPMLLGQQLSMKVFVG